MKKLIAGLVLSLSAAMAFALPAPKQIEQALAAGDYQSAQSMTQEVLREKPDSPKAHLFNAYLLAKQGDKVGANEELNNVNRLDHTDGKVVQNSALYGRTVAELEKAPTARVQPRQAYVAPAPVAVRTTQYSQPVAQPAPVKSGIGFFGWVAILMAVAIIAYMVYSAIKLAAERREEKERELVRQYNASLREEAANRVYSTSGGVSQETPRRAYSNHGRTYDAPPHPVYPAASAAPSHTTTVVNNSGGDHTSGLVQGMLLNEMMHSHSHHGHSERVIERERVYEPAPAYEPVYEAPKPSYESRAASFSSGSDDSWGSSSSSSSSSSWDSGSSSSSSWDSGSSSSSFDSGSSGGGWD